ncbi:glutathione S-transferase N-terminal domain-containing protein [Brevundimonas sp.]|uniref:glutathione S-transferase N-terminal domain-containing protein n=1 Tax=Brevundimonas sp. TaxID=1871086 RepID=UPI0025C50128|nr:glutathione S-transferase N-terminal domain-containing protein [Brevundimonas sp.]
MEELGVDCELVTLPFPPRVRDKAFLEQNPLGTVPLVVDGETRMSESATISAIALDQAIWSLPPKNRVMARISTGFTKVRRH